MSEKDYLGAMSKNVEWIKEKIAESADNIVRIRAKDLAKDMGPEFESEDLIDLYYHIRFVSFGLGILVGRATAYGGDVVYIFKMKSEYDIKPESREEEDKKNKEWYDKLEEAVPGLSEIVKMEAFNEFDPDKVVEMIMDYKDVFSGARSNGEDEVAVEFKDDVEQSLLIEAMVGLTKLEASSIEYEEYNGGKHVVELWWD